MTLEPFNLIEYDADDFALTLYANEYRDKFSGMIFTGYDYDYLARFFIIENCPMLADKIIFASKNGMFCLYSNNKNALEQFACSFKKFLDGDHNIVSNMFVKVNAFMKMEDRYI